MSRINYMWDEKTVEENTYNNVEALPTRNNLQIPRRLFHMANGSVIATLYWLSFSHSQMIRFLGTIACLLYVAEQIRINYPQVSAKFLPITKFVMRAEEQLKESAMVPYAFAVLLTIITFPKPIALVAIFTLAIADPMSAIIGIRFGKRKIVSHKSLEGSAAFFISTLIISNIILFNFVDASDGMIILLSLLIAFFTSCFEMIPLKIDDNLTIPLFVSFIMWMLFESFGIVLL
ncbi:MAG: SEC59/DGK1/VTE5 family protein [Bacteriovoracaceae bacterium]|nr:SEC59/DGK1/VTE5 family protein [Bacteriovoracaceae bacterium]